MELDTQEHQVFVDSVVVYLVPMQVENVNERFEPQLLFLFINLLA